MINAIDDLVRKKNIKYIRIDGNTSSDQRKYFIDKFQYDDSYKCAILSITAANAGITLTAAQLVLFAELHWNPSVSMHYWYLTFLFLFQDYCLIECCWNNKKMVVLQSIIYIFVVWLWSKYVIGKYYNKNTFVLSQPFNNAYDVCRMKELNRVVTRLTDTTQRILFFPKWSSVILTIGHLRTKSMR